MISPRAHARICSIAWRGRGSEGCTDSKRCRTCSAHAAAHKARSRWSESVSVPPRRMVMKRGSRSLGRITVAPVLLHLPNILEQYGPVTKSHYRDRAGCRGVVQGVPPGPAPPHLGRTSASKIHRRASFARRKLRIRGSDRAGEAGPVAGPGYDSLATPLAFGLSLLIVVASIGHISGAHVQPCRHPRAPRPPAIPLALRSRLSDRPTRCALLGALATWATFGAPGA